MESVLLAAEPKAQYQISRVTGKSSRGLEIDGVLFNYPLLRFNLDKATLIFPFCATTGERLENLENPRDESDEEYCLKIIKQLLLDETIKALQIHLKDEYRLPYIWSLIAGEMEAWPASGQKELFRLLRDTAKSTGVRLLSDFSLRPVYSSSGIFYFAETEFEGCQVCSKEPCMMRRAQYNAELANQKGLKIRKVCGRDTA
jgi:hypothetical protein